MAFVDLPTHRLPGFLFCPRFSAQALVAKENFAAQALARQSQPLDKQATANQELAVADLAEGAGEVGPPDAVITGGPVPNSSKLLARKGGFADRLEPADGHYQAHGPLQGKPLLNLTDKGYHKSLFSLSFPLFHS
jgi:hypothetical protein